MGACLARSLLALSFHWSCGGCEGGCGLDAGDELFALVGEGAEVAFRLDAVTEGVGLAEESAEADGHGRSDGARQRADGPSHGVLRNPHGP